MLKGAPMVTLSLTIIFALGLAPATLAQAPTGGVVVPDFSGVWRAGGFEDPPMGRGGVRMHPDYLRRGSRNDDRGRQDPIPAIADPSDPLLRPPVATYIEAIVERKIAGEIIATARGECTPMGTPMLIAEGGPRLILQTENQITMIYEELPEVRRIYLDVAFPGGIMPSYYGESVGHYEGDTLVVTTIAVSDETIVDDFMTPHSESMRVTERYRLLAEGNAIEVFFTVEDPNTFTEAYSGIVIYERDENTGDLFEIRCSENNFDPVTGGNLPMPVARSVDF